MILLLLLTLLTTVCVVDCVVVVSVIGVVCDKVVGTCGVCVVDVGCDCVVGGDDVGVTIAGCVAVVVVIVACYHTRVFVRVMRITSDDVVVVVVVIVDSGDADIDCGVDVVNYGVAVVGNRCDIDGGGVADVVIRCRCYICLCCRWLWWIWWLLCCCLC